MHPSRVRLRTGGCLAGFLLLIATAMAQTSLPGQAVASANATVSPGAATPSPVPAPTIVEGNAPGVSVPTPVAPTVLPARIAPAPVTARTVITDSTWHSPQIDTTRARGAFPARLVNVSVRASIGSGANTLIAGAAIDGTGTLPTLVRAIGPGLGKFGITDTLINAPDLEIFNGNALAAETNTVNPDADAVAQYVGAFPAQLPTGGFGNGDAALVGRPAAGTVTVHCNGSNETSGVAMVEFYDADPTPTATSARFVNFSARGRVGGDDQVLILGFTVAGDGQVTLLLRGLGASLGQYGLTNTLADPAIDLYAGNSRIASNDDWQSGGAVATATLLDAMNEVHAFSMTSTSDAALLVTLAPGTYTLQVRNSPIAASGSAAASGIALAEIYQVPIPPPGLQTQAFDAAQSTNAVGLDLYRQLAGGSTSNLILSPYSIETAFALAYAGAAGDTRNEMAHVLRFPADNATLVSGFTALTDGLNQAVAASVAVAQKRSATGGHVDSISWQPANQLFGQTAYPFRDSYLALLNSGFDAPLQPMDFATNPEASRQAINTWVSNITHDRIKDLIPFGGVTDATRLELVNALYLKAPWEWPFDPATPQPFYFADGTSADVPTLQKDAYIGYEKDTGYRVVTLDYLGGGLQMVLIIPGPGETPDTIAGRLTPQDFARWGALTANTYATIHLPKFTSASDSMDLVPAFRALGMSTAFDIPIGSANFDGIAARTPTDYLSIQSVYHKTFVAVDEQGTEAAAATAIGMSTTSVIIPDLDVRFDHPFLFAIQHKASGACLFLGRITDPR